MRYFEIDFSMSKNGRPKFSPDEVSTIKTSARRVDDFIDKQFGILEKIPKGAFSTPFRKDRVQRMYVLFERLRRKTSEKLNLEVGATVKTFKEPQYWEAINRNLKPGDSVVFYPYKREITFSSVIHEMAHVVYNSFTKEEGVNHNFKDYFTILEIFINSLIKEPKKFHKLLKELYKEEKIQKEIFCYKIGYLLRQF